LKRSNFLLPRLERPIPDGQDGLSLPPG
jgi:hypothetical protein